MQQAGTVKEKRKRRGSPDNFVPKDLGEIVHILFKTLGKTKLGYFIDVINHFTI